MKQWSSVDEILAFAIQSEEDAVQFYNELAGKASSPSIRQIFEGYAREEQGHKAKLQRVKESGDFKPSAERITDLKIGDYLADVAPEEGTDYQKALILAMKREKASFKLYTDLADSTDDTRMKDLFLALAQEEAKHKLRFEIEYDDTILTEN